MRWSAAQLVSENHLEASMDHHATIRRYYDCYRTRDREALRALLAPDFRFRSGFGSHDERDAMLDAIWPAVGQSFAVNLRIFGEAPEFVVLYEHENAPGVDRPRMSMAERVRFDGKRIVEIEVFIGRKLPAAAT